MADVTAAVTLPTSATSDMSFTSSQPEIALNKSKKRSTATSVDNASEGPSPKKKASPKKKNTSKKAVDNEIKTEHDDDADEAAAELQSPGMTHFTAIDPSLLTRTFSDKTSPESSTPDKKNAKGAKDSARRKRAAPTTENNGNRAAPKSGIPKSWEDAGAADRMLYEMKEEGSDWKSIRQAWMDLTGEDKCQSRVLPAHEIESARLMKMPD